MTETTPINLILGSGAARGLAHIGVIRVLEEEGYRIESITGCSMGALVGALYATGHMEAYAEWVSELTRWDVLKFLNLTRFGRDGVVNGDKLMDKLAGWLRGVDIKTLPMPVTVVAADIVARREVWIATGDLLEAVRASIAVPGIFTPLVAQGRVLVDGGILNPVPIPPTVLGNGYMTVAVSLSGRAAVDPLGNGTEATLAPRRRPVSQITDTTPIPDPKQLDGFLNNLQRKVLSRGATAAQPPPREREPKAAAGPNVTDVMLGMFLTMQDTLARHQLASNPPDVLIDIPCNICGSHEFHRARDLIPAGEHWARRALERHFDHR